jgi:Tfp pilus assembly protein PilN
MEIKINLIPPYREEEILKNKRFKLIIKLEIIMFLFVLFFFAFLFGLSYILDLNLKTVVQEAELSQDKKQFENIKKYDEEFGQINTEISKIEKIDNGQLYWSNLFSKISQSMTAGVSIQSVATKDYSIFLVGKSDSRENLVTFKEKLEKDGCFSAVNLPLSDLVAKGNINFQMDMSINEDCIRSVK